jgi:hypothetical protein
MGVSQTDTKVKHRCWTYTVTDAQTYAGIVLDRWHGTEASIGVEGSKLCHVHQCIGGYAYGRSEAHAKCVCHAASLALGHAHTRSSGHELTSTGLAQRNDAAATNGAACGNFDPILRPCGLPDLNVQLPACDPLTTA